MLLAASQTGGGGGTYDDIFGEIPPESTEFGWPLYITIPFKEDYIDGNVFGKTYYLESNEITQQLRQWVVDNNAEEGSAWMPEFYAYPPELYINGILVTFMYTEDPAQSWDTSLTTREIGDFIIVWVTLMEDDSMEIFLRKNS